MRTKTVCRAGLLATLAVLTALAPGRAFGQAGTAGDVMGGAMPGSYSPPAVQLPLPLYSTRPDVGGLFVAGSYVMYQQTNPIKSQEIAVAGFVATDNTIPNTIAGQFVGSRTEVLDTAQLQGPSSYQPGFTVEAGWRFEDGSSITFQWLWLSEAQFSAAATLARPGGQIGNDGADSFIFSNVFNFPSDYAGPPFKLGVGGPEAVFGIWNGASAETILFLQRFQQYQITYRKPFYETECYRASALVGPRFDWIWEKFRWVTTDLDITGNGSPFWTGVFTNVVSNRMYGMFTGLQQEWYLGHGLAAQLTLNGALFLDVVRERDDFSLLARAGAATKRSRTQWTAVPEVQATPSIMWYPIEGVQIQVGYDVFAFFNTISSPRPAVFNYSSLDPNYERTFRLFDGLQAAIAFIF